MSVKKLLTIVILILLMNILVNTEQCSGEITSIIFIGYTYSGFDPYYRVNIVGYREGSYGSLIVAVKNDAGVDILLRNLTLEFDWGDRFSAPGLPEVLPQGTTKIYIIDFVVPSTAKVPHIRPYTYHILANYSKLVTNMTNVTYTWIYTPPDYFAILSKEQKEYYDLRYEFSRLLIQYPVTWFRSNKSIELIRKAFVERDNADYFYSMGNFTGALSRCKSAIDLYKRAVDIEVNYKYTIEEIGINRSLIELESYKVEIEYMRNQMNVNRILAEAELIKASADVKIAEAQSKIADAEYLKAHAEFKRAEAEYESAVNIRYYAFAIIVFGIGFIIISVGLMFRFMKK